MAKNLNIDTNFSSSTIVSSEKKKCPFRKIYHFRRGFDQAYDVVIQCTEKVVEEFQDCIGKDCTCWTPIGCSHK